MVGVRFLLTIENMRLFRSFEYSNSDNVNKTVLPTLPKLFELFQSTMKPLVNGSGIQ